MHRSPLLGAWLLVVAGAAPAHPAGTLAALTQALRRLPLDDMSAAATVDLPTGHGIGRFTMRDSGTLPAPLAARHPGLRSFRGEDADGRTVRLDLSPGGLRMSLRDGARNLALRAVTETEWAALRAAATLPETNTDAVSARPSPYRTPDRDRVPAAGTPRATSRGGGTIRYDFRLAVATGSRYTAKAGGTVDSALAEVAHLVNRANEVFETDVGVHFTLVDDNDRLILTRSARDPFLRGDPVPTASHLIERVIGRANYDIGHALLDDAGGESEVGTSCVDATTRQPEPDHKAAAWSGDDAPAGSPRALDFMLHVLGRQLGAWPTAAGCQDDTLDDRAVEPGSGSTAMGYASATCRAEATLQNHADRYFHAASIAQMHDWLASRGGACATRRLSASPAPWIDPRQLGEVPVIPARTPFALEATATGAPGRRLTYTWEQMDAADRRWGDPASGSGILFRSFPPSPSGRRVFPRMATLLGHERPTAGERLPEISRTLDFRLTVRDNGGDDAMVSHADARVRVVDTGRAFALLDFPAMAVAGERMALRWDVADTDRPPISCHFVHVDLSVDGGLAWRRLADDEPNDGEATVALPDDVATDQARLRLSCDWRPFFAVSRSDFTVSTRVTN